MEIMPADMAGGIHPSPMQQLDPASIPAARMQRAASMLLQCIVAVAGLVGWQYLDEPAPGHFLMVAIAAALWIAGRMILVVWYPPAAWRAAGYRLDDRLLVFNEGVFWQSSTAVPLSRVQHTDVTQGPFERRFGIGRLVVHTAGDAASEVVIWGLAIDTAYRIRDLLTARITGSDGV